MKIGFKVGNALLYSQTHSNLLKHPIVSQSLHRIHTKLTTQIENDQLK